MPKICRFFIQAATVSRFENSLLTIFDDAVQEFIRKDRRKELLYYVNLIRASL